MKTRAPAALAAGILLSWTAPPVGAADAPADAVKKEMARFQGTWQAVSYALDGKSAPAADLKKVRLVIDAAGRTTLKQEGKTLLAATMTLDPANRPRQMDITFTEGRDKGKKALAIYELDGDTLRICRAGPGKARPAEFSSKPGSGHALMTYRGERAKEPARPR
jgi:uncharacterized protein (TIGR03067 family)